MTVTEGQVRQALAQVEDPVIGRDLVALGFVREIAIEGSRVTVTLAVTTPPGPVRAHMQADAHRALTALPGVRSAAVGVVSAVADAPPGTQPRTAPPAGHDAHGHGHGHGHGAPAPELGASIGAFLAVGAGKGGVGKSTLAVHLALELAARGRRVGLADMDLYGPSIPTMLGLAHYRPDVRMLPDPAGGEGTPKIIPAESRGLKVMSLAFLLEQPDQPVIWRGPMIHSAVSQFLGDVDWGELDVLVMDLPPGTGDVALSLSQLVGVTGAVLVSTPQEVALADVRKARAMFGRLNIPVLGLVENMAYYRNPATGEPEYLFGRGGAEELAHAAGVPFLGAVPLDPELRIGADQGVSLFDREGEERESVRALRAAVTALEASLAERAARPPTERIQVQR